MTKRTLYVALLVIISLFTAACANDPQADETETVELTVSAAISLTDALNEIKDAYEEDNNVNITFNFGGSGTLTQQIRQGAPVDVFISADQEWMDQLEEENIIIPDTRENITGNSLVMIANEESAMDYDSFENINGDDIGQIAIGNPESVPAGKYTEQALKTIGLWEELEDKFILAKDVRQVLTYVESGNADIGFVYESDTLTSDSIQTIASADPNWHDPIIYPGAVVANTEYEEEATAFAAYLLSDEAQEILSKHGFEKQQ